MNRKKSSLFFLPLVVIISLIILVRLYIVLLEKSGPLREPIGERQFELLKTYLKAESALFYIDQSAKYALQQAIYELGKNGGLSDVTCSKFYGYSIWYEKDNICFDENKVKLHLEFLFNISLSNYLDNYPSKMPNNNYNYEARDKLEILGKAKESLKLDILKDEKK